MEKLFISSLLLSVLCTGCITTEYHKYVTRNRDIDIEFNEREKSYKKVYSGINAGVVTVEGKQFYHLQFSGILKGNGRYINCYVPLKGYREDGGKPSVFETDKKLHGEKTAFFIHIRTASDYDHDILKNRSVGERTDPRSVLKKYGVSLNNSWPIIGTNLDLGSSTSYRIGSGTWNLHRDGKPVITNDESTMIYITNKIKGIDDNREKLQIRWVQRSRLINGISYLGYVGTVIADIVTSPIQLIVVIIYAANQ